MLESLELAIKSDGPWLSKIALTNYNRCFVVVLKNLSPWYLGTGK
jgi:hypothetical protein